MRRKLSILAIIAFLGTITLLPVQAISATLWADVTVDSVFYSTNGRCIAYFTEADPTNPVFTNKKFRTTKSAEDSKAILAIILAAQSSGKTLRIGFDDSGNVAELKAAGVVD